jgi:IS5 family transposase
MSTRYRGHRAANPRRVFISGQKRCVFDVIKRELRRRCAIEAEIGHMKTDGHLGRCYLKGREGDAANVITRLGLAQGSLSPNRARARAGFS